MEGLWVPMVVLAMILSLPKTSPAGHPPRNVLVRRLPRFDKFQRRPRDPGLGPWGVTGAPINWGFAWGYISRLLVGVVTYPYHPWDWYYLATWMVVCNGEIW